MNRFLSIGQPVQAGVHPERVGQFYEMNTGHIYGDAIQFTLLRDLGSREVSYPGWMKRKGPPTVVHRFLVRVEDKEMIISLRGPNTSAAHALRMLIGGHRKPMVIDAIAKHMQSPRGDFYVWRFFPTYWPGSDIRTPESYRAHLQKYLTLNMDFHSVVAERLGISRDEAKRRNFWSLYGGDPRRFAIFPKGAAMKKQKPNNYFVVPNSVGERYEGIGEGHPTLKAAVTDASERTNKDGVERCVLQRVRVIRRKPQPVVVEKVKA